MLIVDAANVVGSRPDGWWRDRPGAARRLIEQIAGAVEEGAVEDEAVVVVLEGRARAGAAEQPSGPVRVVHAQGEGDDTIADLASDASAGCTVVTADRGLVERVRAAGAEVVGPRWLLDRLG